MFPAESSATPEGEVSWAAVAGPPSPEKPELPSPPEPATVVMMPAEFTLRMRLVPGSAMYTFPLVSAASPMWVAPAKTSPACVAGPPSPIFAGAPAPGKLVDDYAGRVNLSHLVGESLGKVDIS